MHSLVLHHYELSPFSEKVRRILAFKRLAWQSVRAPAVMPKPDLVALTGGYRKIPVLQVGNHVYCDTALIAERLEQLAAAPTLYPTPLAHALAHWADTTLFDAAVPVALRPTRLDDILRWLTPDEMNKFADDRKALGSDTRRAPPPGRVARTHLAQYLTRIDATLSSSPYLLGTLPSIADFSVYVSAWFLKVLAPEPLSGLASVAAWMERIAALADPPISTLSSVEAVELCRQSPPTQADTTAWSDPLGLAFGQAVVVRALDYGRDPVTGTLFSSRANEVTLRREDERAGVVYVHFPRIGYEISAVK
jgi:glutathione S-transferase